MSKQFEDRQDDRYRRMVAPELLVGLDAIPSIQWTEEALAQSRSFDMRQMPVPPMSPELSSVRREERLIPGSSGAPNVRILIYRTADRVAEPQPLYFHVHGGGYIMGAPEMNEVSNRSIAYNQRCVVVSVDYRLAPETRYPSSLEDCYAALLWSHGRADELNIDTARIAIGGESAGGGHAAALAILARDRAQVPVSFQLLESPMLDDRTGSISEPHPFAGRFVWTSESNRFGWQALLGIEPGSGEVPIGAVPARTPDLTGLPATCITIGALDLFLEETLEYVRRLNRAGVPTELHVIPGAYHGYQMSGAGAPQVQQCERLRAEALSRAFREHH
jgi:acetyl esterase/lipase